MPESRLPRGARVVGDTPAIDAAARADGVELVANPGSRIEVVEPYWTSPCGRAKVYVGDNLRVMGAMDQDQFHAICTDPPYLLHFMSKDWDKEGEDLPTSEVAFRAWLTGLIAGEGCFRIHREKNGSYYACHFSIHMRADESPMLYALARRTGLGRMTRADEVTNKQGIHSSPSVTWLIDTRDQCRKLVNLIGDFPLYGKKQREFDLWKDALEAWENTPRGSKWTGPRDNTAMERLWEEMKTLRPFDEELADVSFYPTKQPNYLFHFKWTTEAFRIMKPGAHIASFGGTRTYHRLACGIEDAGFEDRDTLMWLYSTGFPKGQDVSKAIDKLLGAERTETNVKRRSSALGGRLHSEQAGVGGYGFGQEWGVSEPVTDAAKQWRGWNTQLKPSYEPIVIGRKPLTGTVAECVLTNGTGAINIDGCRVGTTGRDVVRDIHTKTSSGTGVYGFNEGAAGEETMRGGYSEVRKDGRHPANLAHDGSDEVVSRMPEGTARFFYTAKADSSDRPHDRNSDAAVHLTVKPLELMRWLVRLVCARGGTVLDPFMGSGSTGVAAILEGQRFVGIEQSQEYADIAVGRLKLALAELGTDACAPAPGAPLRTSPLSAPTARKLRGVE